VVVEISEGGETSWHRSTTTTTTANVNNNHYNLASLASFNSIQKNQVTAQGTIETA